MEFPLYEMFINPEATDDTEVSYVALVDVPAIRKNFLLFSNKQAFAIADEDERIITGPLMLADMPIYRRDTDRGEHFVVFKADTIKHIVQKFFKKGFHANVNIMHDPDLKTDGIYMFESWIIDTAKGKPALPGFEDVAEGSWFGSYKVENEDVWAEVKAGTFKGFSVEGIFDMLPMEVKTKEQEFLEELQKVLAILED